MASLSKLLKVPAAILLALAMVSCTGLVGCGESDSGGGSGDTGSTDSSAGSGDSDSGSGDTGSDSE